MGIKFANNAATVLASGITASDTSLTVISSTGDLFPALGGSDYFYATLGQGLTKLEIIKVTARSADTFTITRGQDGTTAQAFNAGDIVELRPVAGIFTDPTLLTLTQVTTALGYTPLSGNQTITFTGDATGSGATSVSLTLANSGVTAGSYGSSTSVPVITVDAKGRLTSVTTSSISGSLTFTGDVTGTGATGGTTTLTLASVGTAGTYTKVTTDAKGRVTSGTTLSSSDLPTYTGTLTSSQVTTALGFTPAANGQTMYIGTTAVNINRASGAITLTGTSIDGNAATVTKGVYTTGDQTVDGVKTFRGSGTTDAYMYLSAANGIAVFQIAGSGTNSAFLLFANSTNNERSRITVDNGRNLYISNNSGTTNHFTFGSTGNFTATGSLSGASLAGTAATGSGASGTWGISISGNAATASSAAALTSTTWQRITGSAIDYGSYGSIGVSGVTNTYAGISFSGVSGTLMMNASASGFYYSNSTWRVYWDGSGNQLNTGNVTAYASDERLKRNIQAIDTPFDILDGIDGVFFDWDLAECNKWNFHPPEHDAGLLAQKVMAVYPFAVHQAPFDKDPLVSGGSKSGKHYLTVQYEKLVPVLVAASKRLKAANAEQDARIAKLEALVSDLSKGKA